MNMNIGFNEDYLNKNIYTKKITIDSYDRNKKYIPMNDTRSNSNNYQINLDKYPELQKNVIGISLVNAFIPNSEYLINNYNNKFNLFINNNIELIELEIGNYHNNLNTNLEAQLKTNDPTFKINYDIHLNIYTIECDNPFTLLFETGVCTNINEILGVDKLDIESKKNLTTGKYEIKTGHLELHPSKYVDIVVDEIPKIGLIHTTKDENSYILDRVFFDNQYGNYKLHYTNDYDRIYNFFNAIEIKNLTIKLYNDKNKIYDSKYLDNVLTFEFILLKNDLVKKEFKDNLNMEKLFIKYLKEFSLNKTFNDKNNKQLINMFNQNLHSILNKNQSFNEELLVKIQNNKIKNDNEGNQLKDENKDNNSNFNLNNLILIIIIICLLLKIFI